MTWRAALGVQAQRAKRVKGEPRSWAHIREKRAEQERIELAAARMEVAAAISGSLGPDEAAAILISRWAAHAREVNAVIPKRQRRVIDHG
jgi:predicted PP-loop superfamily ATPase